MPDDTPEHLKNDYAFSSRLPNELLEPFTHDTVNAPVPDLIRLEIPEELENSPLAKSGLVDVTHPFFNADMDGERDSTAAVRKAVEFARNHQMVCYFPRGTYLVSDTITCIQNLYLPKNGENYQTGNGRVAWARNFPCVLMGSRKDPASRPVLKLAPNSPGFGKPGKPKRVIHFWARSFRDPEQEQASIAMNNLFVGIDIHIGKDNPGAIGIRMRSAQGSAVLHSTIDATHGLVGLEGGAGSGGSHAGITVIGGKIGIDMTESQPCPSLTDVTLIGQTKHAILYRGKQSLTATGLRIEAVDANPMIACPTSEAGPLHGQLSLVDSILVGKDSGIESGRGVYLKNVYAKGLSRIVSFSDGTSLPGAGEQWTRISEYAWSPSLPPLRHAALPEKIQYRSGVWIDGKRINRPYVKKLDNDPPPKNLMDRHRLPALPDWQNATSVKDYGAVGNARHDDREALQRAIDKNTVVFLPKGLYRISDTLKLKPDTALVGLGCSFSMIMIHGDEPAFAGANVPRPLIETANDPEAATLLAFCGIMVPFRAVKAVTVDWKCGRNSATVMPRFFSTRSSATRRNLLSNSGRHPWHGLPETAGGAGSATTRNTTHGSERTIVISSSRKHTNLLPYITVMRSTATVTPIWKYGTVAT